MSKDEFLFDYSLDYIFYMLEKYFEENYSSEDSSSDVETVSILDVL